MCRDVLDEFNRYDREQSEALERLPVCCICGEPIQGEMLYEIGDELFCEECIRDCKRYVDDYMND